MVLSNTQLCEILEILFFYFIKFPKFRRGHSAIILVPALKGGANDIYILKIYELSELNEVIS